MKQRHGKMVVEDEAETWRYGSRGKAETCETKPPLDLYNNTWNYMYPCSFTFNERNSIYRLTQNALIILENSKACTQ